MTFADYNTIGYDPTVAIINEMIATPDQIAAFDRFCEDELPFARSTVSRDPIASYDLWSILEDIDTDDSVDLDLAALAEFGL